MFSAVFADFGLILTRYGTPLLMGIAVTLALTAIFVVCGGVIALMLTGLRLLPWRGFEWAVAVYVLYHRSVPLVVQMLFWYFGMPQLLPAAFTGWVNNHSGEFIYAAIALSVSFGAYASEDLRSGLRSLPQGQHDAAKALGLGFLDRMAFVLIPQALRAAAPPLASQTLLFFKATSLAAAIGVSDLAHVAQEINNETFMTFPVFFLSTAAYVLMSLGVLRACDAAQRWLDGARGASESPRPGNTKDPVKAAEAVGAGR